MTQFQAFSPKVQVSGEAIISVIDGMKVFKSGVLKILNKNGIHNPAPGEWYSQQAWLDTLKEIAEELGEKRLYHIGKSIPDNAIFPKNIDSVEKALSMIDKAYHMNHIGGEIGCYRFKKILDRAAKMFCQNPFPCEFDKGIITSMAEKFKPSDSKGISLLHPPKAKCRKKGDDGCIYVITW